MKSHKRRSRIVAGLALVAASAAVASAMFGPALAVAGPVPPLAASASHAARSFGLPLTFDTRHAPVKPGARGSGKRSQALIIAVGSGAGARAASGLIDAAATSSAGAKVARAWWLDWADACSRTRGQPRTDALT